MLKRRVLALSVAFGLALLAGCTGPVEVPPPTETPVVACGQGIQPVEATPFMPSYQTCRIVDGAETGKLVLAGVDGGAADVYLVDAAAEGVFVAQGGGSSGWSELRDGMTVTVQYSGAILETFPAQFDGVSIISVEGDETNDLAGLYLQVLEDLWTVDSGLNDGITQLGVDLSQLEGFSDSEKSAMAYVFGMAHGILPVTGTDEELRDRGYFTEVDLGADAPPDRKLYQWEDGCLFSLEGNTDGFSAQKWCAPLGAYYYEGCTASERDGVWTYKIGSEAIS